MNDKLIKKIMRKIILETVDKNLVSQIIKKLEKSTSQYSWTLGGGTDEEAFVSAIQEIPNVETAEAVNNSYNLRDNIDSEFNFSKDSDWGYVTQIYDHLKSIGVKIINPNDQNSFNFEFPKTTTQPVVDDGKEEGSKKDKEKEQEEVIVKNKCIKAPLLSSICSGTSYLKNCMKGDKTSTEDAVYKVQQFLISKGFVNISKTGQPDWIYGPLTKSMVIQYQKSVGLKPDGIAGPQTVSTMGICTKSDVGKDDKNTLPGPVIVPDDKTTTTTTQLPGPADTDVLDVKEYNCDIQDKQVIKAYNSIKEGMRDNDPSYLRRECKIVIDYQSENDQHCDNLEEVICFCGTKASSGDDGYGYLGSRKKYLKNYVATYCKSDFVDTDKSNPSKEVRPNAPIIEGCQTPGNVIAILQQEDEDLSKDDCKILFSEAVNWYESWKKCERTKHSANPAYESKCLACLNKYNFNWKDLGSGENKVMKMYGFNKRQINKKQRRELPRMESIEALNTALLYMKYDMKKTLTENKESK
jgi:hypothetical protein